MSIVEEREETEPAAEVREVRVAIVGSGFGGIGTAIQLREAGYEDFVILERAQELGGTWAANTYPGCACDVPSHLYSYSFAPNPDWSRFFAPQSEILAYLQRTAADRGVTDRIVYGAEMTAARWDAGARRWHVTTTAGDFRAQFLVSAAGPLSEPSIPDIPGLADFEGTVFHSARWNHDHDLTGERVAVIGTGASSAQFVPRIAAEVGQLDVYQRTPGWVMPRIDRPVTARERKLFRRVPAAQRLVRNVVYYAAELLVVGLTKDRRILKGVERVARRKLAKSVPDPAIRAKLTPSFTLGCKRIIFSDDYLPTFMRPNVELVTDGIERIDATGIVARDGTHRAADTIVLGTGFKIWDAPIGSRITGADGSTLADAWSAAGGPQAYVGTVISGFPNLFFLIGPNTGLGNNSMINIIEGQLVFVVEALKAMDRTGADAIDVHRDVQDRYNVHVQELMEGTVWTEGGCKSWYLSADGSNRVLWPSFSNTFKAQLREFDAADFQVSS